jgi:hypothetical protein
MNGTAKSRVPKGEAPARFLGDRGPGLGLVCAGSGARQRSNGDSVSERLKRPICSPKRDGSGGLPGANAGRWMGVRGMGLLGPTIQVSQCADNP